MPTGERAHLRVLIADDVPEQRALLEAAILYGGLEVVAETATGEAALNAVAAHRPDVAILDVSMPGLSGLEVAAEIRRLYPETTIVVVSGRPASEMDAEARRAGADLYLEKGQGITDLVTAIKQIAEGSHQPAQSASPTTARRRARAPVNQADEFISFVAHELKGPVAAIEGFAARLADAANAQDPERVSAAAHHITEASARLTSLLQTFRDVRQLDTGTLELELTEADLAQLAREKVAVFEARLAPRTLTLNAAGLVPVRCDPARVGFVLWALLENAARFGPADQPIEIAAGALDGQAAVRVQDHGPGIPEHSRHELFGKYRRFDKSQPGAGLSLYLARGICRAHSGDLTYTPRNGGGASFLATFGPVVSSASA